jgi:DNA adenine methylase
MNNRLRSPIGYFGGKGKMVKKLLPLFPPHKHYCEPFFGGGSLFFAKPPSLIETINDKYSEVVNFFRVLRDENKFSEFYRKVNLIPYAREEFHYYRQHSSTDLIDRAIAFFVTHRLSFGGNGNHANFGFVRTTTHRGMAETVSKYLSAIDMMPEISTRLKQAQIEHLDFEQCMKNVDSLDTFFFCDPPYLPETRKGGRYNTEMTEDEHKRFLELCTKLSGKILICGYSNDLYDEALKSWATKEWQVACHAVGRTKRTGILGKGSALKMQPRIEKVWFNYNKEDGLEEGKKLGAPGHHEKHMGKIILTGPSQDTES